MHIDYWSVFSADNKWVINGHCEFTTPWMLEKGSWITVVSRLSDQYSGFNIIFNPLTGIAMICWVTSANISPFFWLSCCRWICSWTVRVIHLRRQTVETESCRIGTKTLVIGLLGYDTFNSHEWLIALRTRDWPTKDQSKRSAPSYRSLIARLM